MNRIAERGRRPRAVRVATVLAGLVLAGLFLPPPPAEAAGFSVGFAASRLWGDNWGRGIEADLFLPMGNRSGLRFGGGVILDSGAFEGFGAAMLDIGFWRSYGSRRLRSVVLAGLSLSVGDPQGTDLNGIGAHLGLREELWLGRGVGFYGRAILRLWLPEGGLDAFAPSFGAGMCFRF